MDELLAILAKATSGLVEWAPNQLGPLVAMQTARFDAVIPMNLAGLVISLIALAASIGFILLGGLVVEQYTTAYDVFLAIGVVLGLCALIGTAIFGIQYATFIIEQRVFTAAPELYVLKALLGK